MAAPHVTGAVALFLQANPSANPDQVTQAIVSCATQGKVTGPGTGSPNRLLLVQAIAAPTPPPSTSCSETLQLIANPSFEQSTTGWTTSEGVITTSATYPAKSGSAKAWLNGYGEVSSDFIYQNVQIPSNACSAQLTFWMWIDTTETENVAYDRLRVQVLDLNGALLKGLGLYSNLNATSSYIQKTFDLVAFKGKTIRIRFLGREDEAFSTSYIIDDVQLTVKR